VSIDELDNRLRGWMCLKADQLGHGCVCYTDGRVCCNGGCLIETAGFVTEAAASGDRRGGGEGVAGQAAGLWQDSHGIPPGTEKAALGAAFFFFYSISSEYQIERINPPNIIEHIVV